jgi:subtilisin family serine protease
MPSSAWNIDAVRSREAMTRVAGVLGPTNDWAGILVAHMDTGYSNHAVFNLGGTTPAIRIADGRNYMDSDAALPLDPLHYAGGFVLTPGHGTRTLGTLCGNLPGTYVGVCPTVPVVPYRVTNGVALTGDSIVYLAQAIMDAVDRNLADVISISLGVQSVFGNHKQMHALGRAVDHAYERGVIVVGAAGQTEDAPQLVGFTVYPGRYSRTILVGGINEQRKICFDYDDGRKYVDVWAPADNVRRPNAVFGLPEPFIDVGQTGDGTSYATVHVAAAAAMWLRVRGQELEDGGLTGWRRVEAFRAALRSSFQPLAGNDVPPKRKVPTDSGILDCVRLLDSKLAKPGDLKAAPLAEPETN